MREHNGRSHSKGPRRGLRVGLGLLVPLAIVSGWSMPGASAGPVSATVSSVAGDELTIVFDQVVSAGTTVGDIVVKRGLTYRVPEFYPEPWRVEDACPVSGSGGPVYVYGDPGTNDPAVAYLPAPNTRTLVVQLETALGPDPGGQAVIVGADGVSPPEAYGCVHFSAI